MSTPTRPPTSDLHRAAEVMYLCGCVESRAGLGNASEAVLTLERTHALTVPCWPCERAAADRERATRPVDDAQARRDAQMLFPD